MTGEELTLDHKDGHYFVPDDADRDQNSYTLFIAFSIEGTPYPSVAAARADCTTDEGSGYVEEIDVKAYSEEQAKKVCLLAMARDYDPHGTIIEVRENVPGITYF